MTLRHFFTGRVRLGNKLSKWTIHSASGGLELETGSSVIVLKWLRARNLPVPEIMAGPSCWDQEYEITFKLKAVRND